MLANRFLPVTKGRQMSKPSDKAAGNVQRLLGEVLGDGKLVEEGDRQMREGNTGGNAGGTVQDDRLRKT